MSEFFSRPTETWTTFSDWFWTPRYLPVKSAFPNSAPPQGECAGINAPAFTMLHELTSRGSFSLLGGMDTALEVPRLGGETASIHHPRGNRSQAALTHTPRVSTQTGTSCRACSRYAYPREPINTWSTQTMQLSPSNTRVSVAWK